MLQESITINAIIGRDGTIRLPLQYKHLYGQRVVIRVDEIESNQKATFNPNIYVNTVNWPMDGVDYQHHIRDEWS